MQEVRIKGNNSMNIAKKAFDRFKNISHTNLLQKLTAKRREEKKIKETDENFEQATIYLEDLIESGQISDEEQYRQLIDLLSRDRQRFRDVVNSQKETDESVINEDKTAENLRIEQAADKVINDNLVSMGINPQIPIDLKAIDKVKEKQANIEKIDQAAEKVINDNLVSMGINPQIPIDLKAIDKAKKKETNIEKIEPISENKLTNERKKVKYMDKRNFTTPWWAIDKNTGMIKAKYAGIPLDELQKMDLKYKGLVGTFLTIPLIGPATTLIGTSLMKINAELWNKAPEFMQNWLHSANVSINNFIGSPYKFLENGNWINANGTSINNIDSLGDVINLAASTAVAGVSGYGFVKGIKAIKDKVCSHFKNKGNPERKIDNEKPWKVNNEPVEPVVPIADNTPVVNDNALEVESPINDEVIVEPVYEEPIKEAIQTEPVETNGSDVIEVGPGEYTVVDENADKQVTVEPTSLEPSEELTNAPVLENNDAMIAGTNIAVPREQKQGESDLQYYQYLVGYCAAKGIDLQAIRQQEANERQKEENEAMQHSQNMQNYYDQLYGIDQNKTNVINEQNSAFSHDNLSDDDFLRQQDMANSIIDYNDYNNLGNSYINDLNVAIEQNDAQAIRDNGKAVSEALNYAMIEKANIIDRQEQLGDLYVERASINEGGRKL